MKNFLTLAGLTFLIILNSCSTTEKSAKRQKNNLYQNTTLSKIIKVKPEHRTFITPEGELKALFVFVQFDNDSTFKSKYWKYDTLNLPDWTKNIVNRNSGNYFPYKNLSQYYFEMSRGKFIITGDVYPKLVRPKYDESHYKNISEVNYEILKRLDDKIDFSKYDNWTKKRDNTFIKKPDGKVDMIYLIYRNFSNRLFFNNGWTGIAHLYLTKDIKTNDNVTIKTGRLDKGSGIVIRGGKNGFYWLKYVAAHELGHFLFGAGHIENVTDLALMTGGPVWNASRGMHSWERNYLGWINYRNAVLNKDSSYILSDYITTGDALRLKLNEKEWFVLENHRHLSVHDKSGDKGIYIYHITHASSYSPKITVECADGNWDFKIDKQKHKLIKLKPNLYGQNEMNFRKMVNGKNYACFKPLYKSNAAWGDKNDAFDLTYNNVFSPVSNPSSKNKSKINFTIEVVSKKGKNYKVKFYFKNPYEGKPSKPYILKTKINKRNFPTIIWKKSKEPDLKLYKIYISTKPKNKSMKFQLLETVPVKKQINNLIKWTDTKHRINGLSSYYIYTISAVDKDNHESVLAEPVKVYR